MKEEWEGGLTQKVVNSILGEVHLYRHGGSESLLAHSLQQQLQMHGLSSKLMQFLELELDCFAIIGSRDRHSRSRFSKSPGLACSHRLAPTTPWNESLLGSTATSCKDSCLHVICVFRLSYKAFSYECLTRQHSLLQQCW